MVVSMVAYSPDGDPVLEYDNDYSSPISPGGIVTFPYEFQIPDAAPIGWYNIKASASLGGVLCSGSDQKQISRADAFMVEANCLLPDEAVLTVKDQLPDHYHSITFSSSELGTKTFPDPILPVTSILAGTNNSEANGFILRFSSDGLDYSCPIFPSMISIEFNGDGRNITDVLIQSVGAGSNSSVSEVAAFVSYDNYKFAELPGTTVIRVNQPPPGKVYEISFSTDSQRTVIASLPVEERVMGIWIAADGNLQEPHLYFRTSNGWYAASVGLSSGKLFTFGVETEISEVAVAVDDVFTDGTIRIGYVYPVPVELEADAGTDQIVQEVQNVYLDGDRHS